MIEKLTHDTLPEGVTELRKEVHELKRLFLEKREQQSTKQADQWFGLSDLVKYDPARRSKATWYSKISRGEVPHHKNGKNLVFLKSEIDDWLKTGKRKSHAEIEAEADNYLKNKGGKDV